MSPFYFFIVVLLNLQIYVMSVKEDVLGAVGGAVTLHLCDPGAKSIIWILVKKTIIIATTKPQESPGIYYNEYKGRLSSTPDGSLIITELRLEDQGTYRAQFLIDKETKTCDYHLTVFNVMSVKKEVLGAVGGAVTLHLCYTGAKSITWHFVTKGITFARTKLQESPEIEDSNYDGRLSSTPDGSLIITELRLEDQGTYRAQFRTDKGTKICDYHLTVFSNLTAENVTINPNVTDNKTCEVSLTCLVDSGIGSKVTIIWRSLNSSDVNQTENVVFVPPSNIHFTYICTAKNPVSNVSKNVVPWLYCNNGMDRENTPKEDYSMVNLIRLVISGCVLLISCCIFIHHMKTEVISQPPETGAI